MIVENKYCYTLDLLNFCFRNINMPCLSCFICDKKNRKILLSLRFIFSILIYGFVIIININSYYKPFYSVHIIPLILLVEIMLSSLFLNILLLYFMWTNYNKFIVFINEFQVSNVEIFLIIFSVFLSFL